MLDGLICRGIMGNIKSSRQSGVWLTATPDRFNKMFYNKKPNTPLGRASTVLLHIRVGCAARETASDNKRDFFKKKKTHTRKTRN